MTKPQDGQRQVEVRCRKCGRDRFTSSINTYCPSDNDSYCEWAEPAPQQPAPPERLLLPFSITPETWTSIQSVAYVREDIALASAEGHDNSAFVYAATIKLAIEIIKHEATVEEAIKSLVAVAATNSPVVSVAEGEIRRQALEEAAEACQNLQVGLGEWMELQRTWEGKTAQEVWCEAVCNCADDIRALASSAPKEDTDGK